VKREDSAFWPKSKRKGEIRREFEHAFASDTHLGDEGEVERPMEALRQRGATAR
jgi:hypothetical protein